MRAMRTITFLFTLGTLATAITHTTHAHAFGGSADHLGHQGNFVVSNRAALGFDQGLSYHGTSLYLGPELDYFVIEHLSIGGAIVVAWNDQSGANLGVVPQVGYDVVLSPTWSLWPRLAVTVLSGSPAHGSVELSAPFLVHPVEHFFFGFGPAVSTDFLGDNKITHIYGSFLIGGYFDS